jgi:hypothetical protein
MTWALLAWVALIIVWIAVGVNSTSDDCDDEATASGRELCEAATDVGTGIGVGIIVIIGFMGFIVLALIWFMTRPKPQPEIRYVPAPVDGNIDTRPVAEKPPPPPRSTKPAGWYNDPSGKFDMRWFEGTWTEHVANEGDDTTYIDPVPPR